MRMAARVPMISLDRARELGEAMGMPARRTQSEAFRTLANNPGVARVAYSQLIQLLENNKFDTRLRELMIMRIGWVTGSAYEWTQHWRVETTAGIPPEDLLAARDWRNFDGLHPADQAVLARAAECGAGSERRLVGGEEQRAISLFYRLARPAQRGQRDLVGALVDIGRIQHRRHIAGMHRVDTDTQGAIAHRRRFRIDPHRSF